MHACINISSRNKIDLGVIPAFISLRKSNNLNVEIFNIRFDLLLMKNIFYIFLFHLKFLEMRKIIYFYNFVI